jgi:hypothetical protein
MPPLTPPDRRWYHAVGCGTVALLPIPILVLTRWHWRSYRWVPLWLILLADADGASVPARLRADRPKTPEERATRFLIFGVLAAALLLWAYLKSAYVGLWWMAADSLLLALLQLPVL